MLLHLRNAIVLLGMLLTTIGLTHPTATLGVLGALLPGEATAFASNDVRAGS